jgi:hypothetical protein
MAQYTSKFPTPTPPPQTPHLSPPDTECDCSLTNDKQSQRVKTADFWDVMPW